MSWLPKNSILGDLDIEEVFVFFDGPRVFTCRSLTDQIYLAGWAEENLDSDLWLYLPISNARLKMIRSGAWPLKDAYLNPEAEIYCARLHHDLQIPDEVTVIDKDSLEDKWLPDDDFRIEIQTATHSAAVSPEVLLRKSIQEGRTRFRIEIQSDNRLRSEASTRQVAAVLSATQNVIDNFGNIELATDPSQEGRFSRQVRDKMDTDVIELAAASFVIEIGSSDGDDLFGDSPVARVLNRLISLLSVQIDPDSLWESLADLKPRAAKSFRAFVNELSNLDSNVTLAMANTQHKYRSEALTSDQLIDLKLLLRQIVPDEIKELRGRMNLFLGNNERRNFGLRDLYSDKAFEGRVGESAVSQFEHATLGNIYDVVLSSYSNFDKGAGIKSEKYVLEQLTVSTDQTPIPLQLKLINEVAAPIFSAKEELS